MQRELGDVRLAIEKMAGEGTFARHPSMNASIAEIRSR